MPNFTPIVNGDSRKNDKAIWNDPMTELSDAIDAVDTLVDGAIAKIGTAASSSGTLGTSIDTDGTLKAGAVDVAAVLADNVVTGAKLSQSFAVTGAITAGSFIGNGAGLTGITGATGGVANTGSTTVGADTDVSGSGEIALQTRNVTRLTVGNTGTVAVADKLTVGSDADAVQQEVTGRVQMTGRVSPSSGAEEVLRVTANPYTDAGGNQWAAIFVDVTTVAGQPISGQADGILTAIFHDQAHTIPEWKGVEVGGAFVGPTAGALITDAWGLDANLPTVTGSGAVTRAAAVHIASGSVSGIGTPYAILSEQTANSLFKGRITIQNQSTSVDAFRDSGSPLIQVTSHGDASSYGGLIAVRHSRGTNTAPTHANNGDALGKYSAYGYVNGAFRETANFSFYAQDAGWNTDATWGTNMLIRAVAAGGTALATAAVISAGDGITAGSQSGQGTLNMYAARLGLGTTTTSLSSKLYVLGTDTVASEASATLRSLYTNGGTVTLSGATNITTATGFNMAQFDRPMITAASAVTITNSATVYISGAPAAAGSAAITNAYALWVDDGTVKIDNGLDAAGTVVVRTAVAMGGGAAPTLGTIGGSGPTAAAQNEWMKISTQNGVRYVPVWA